MGGVITNSLIGMVPRFKNKEMKCQKEEPIQMVAIQEEEEESV
jgi:hypothetical protein